MGVFVEAPCPSVPQHFGLAGASNGKRSQRPPHSRSHFPLYHLSLHHRQMQKPLPGLAVFASSFASLTSLVLRTFHTSPDNTSPLLAALPCPRKLQHLELDGTAAFPSLTRFTHLVSFSVSQELSPPSNLLSTLRRIPQLEELVIPKGSGIATDAFPDLIKLVSRSPRPSRLRLEQFSGAERGASVFEFGPSWHWEGYWSPHRDSWILPADCYFEYYPDIEHYEKLFEAASRHGVDIMGNVKDAVEILKEFRREEEWVEEHWIHRPPPSSKAELEFYSQERVPGQSWRGD